MLYVQKVTMLNIINQNNDYNRITVNIKTYKIYQKVSTREMKMCRGGRICFEEPQFVHYLHMCVWHFEFSRVIIPRFDTIACCPLIDGKFFTLFE